MCADNLSHIISGGTFVSGETEPSGLVGIVLGKQQILRDAGFKIDTFDVSVRTCVIGCAPCVFVKVSEESVGWDAFVVVGFWGGWIG